MRKTEKKEVTSKQEVTTGYKCDCCGKEINATQLPNEWHNFNSHHDEWGNDSIDSYEYYDVCSPKCYKDKMIQIVEAEELDIFKGKTEAEKANIFWKHALPILSKNI